MAEPQSEYVQENPVDEVLYPSYDEAGAAVLELYGQYGSAARNHIQGVVETRDIAQAQALDTAMTASPGATTEAEALAATDDLSSVIDLISTELAIMEQSRENYIAMTQNTMTNYISALQEGLPYLEQYVDARLANLEGVGGSRGPSGPLTDGTDDGVDDGGLSDEDKAAIAEDLGMTVEEAFPNADNPDSDFDWSGEGREAGKSGFGIVSQIYGTIDNYDYYYEKSLRTQEIETDRTDAEGNPIVETVEMAGTDPSHYEVSLDENGIATLRPLFQDYANLYRYFIGEGASVESAERMALERLQTNEYYGEDFARLTPEDKGALQSFVKVNSDMYHVENGRPDMVEPLTPKEAEGMGLYHEDTHRVDQRTGEPARRVHRGDDVEKFGRLYYDGEYLKEGEDLDGPFGGTVDLNRYGLGDEYSIDSVSLTTEQVKDWHEIDQGNLEDQQEFLKPIAEAQDIQARGKEYYQRSATELGLLPGEHEDVGFWEDLWYGKDEGDELSQETIDALADFSHRVPDEKLRHLSEAEMQSARDYAARQRGGQALGELMRSYAPKVEERVQAVGAGITDAASNVSQGLRNIRDRDDFDEMYAKALADKKAREEAALMQLAAQNVEWDALSGTPRTSPAPAPTYDSKKAADYAGFKIF